VGACGFWRYRMPAEKTTTNYNIFVVEQIFETGLDLFENVVGNIL